ncbi:MAG: hypothetical protein AAEJ52_20680 [Myxococcota bacterium]
MSPLWSRSRLALTSLTVLVCVTALLSAPPVLACSVCYGDPNSAMNQGAQAGVLVLLGVVGVVLAGIASLLIFWMRRAAQIKTVDEARDTVPSASRTPFSHA